MPIGEVYSYYFQHVLDYNRQEMVLQINNPITNNTDWTKFIKYMHHPKQLNETF